MKTLLLRADASTQIGGGHVMRCLALAQAWQDAGGQAHFAAAEIPDNLIARLASEGMSLHGLDVAPGSLEDAVQTAALAQRLCAAWIVEDGYRFGADFQRSIKDVDLHLLAIDDYGHAGHNVADLVLNQNVYAKESIYPSIAPGTRLLLGTQYVLLRREFLRWRSWQRQIPNVARKVLVTMGGGDPDNVTLKVIEALAQIEIDRLEVVVVAGASNLHVTDLQDAIKRSSYTILLERNVENMAELMTWADVVVSAGGSTCWELAFMGAPTMVICLAENQMAVANGLANSGAALNLGWHALLTGGYIARSLTSMLLSADSRRHMSQHGRDMVDGHGASRVIRLLKPAGMTLRPVQYEDSHLIWEWANDPVAHAQSFSSDPILYKTHEAWFEKRLSDPLTHFYLALDGAARPIGQIRFQVEGETATVSVTLASEQRGKGYGAELIRLGSRQIWLATQVMEIYAYIKPGNPASIPRVAQAGYEIDGAMTIQGCAAQKFRLRRPQANADNT